MIQQFVEHLAAGGTPPKKIADINADPEKASGYSYKIEKGVDYRKYKGWVYFIACNEDDEVIKIGQTDATLASRFSSYQAGTSKS